MKMKFTNNKLENEFFEWLRNKSFIFAHSIEPNWGDLPQSAQFGLFQEFCDTKDIDVEAFNTGYFKIGNCEYWADSISMDFENNRPEAQIEAFNKVNEIWE